jgi:hypothetical protein
MLKVMTGIQPASFCSGLSASRQFRTTAGAYEVLLTGLEFAFWSSSVAICVSRWSTVHQGVSFGPAATHLLRHPRIVVRLSRIEADFRHRLSGWSSSFLPEMSLGVFRRHSILLAPAQKIQAAEGLRMPRPRRIPKYQYALFTPTRRRLC